MDVGTGGWSRARRWGVAAVASSLVLLGRWLAPTVWSTAHDFLSGPDASEPSCSWPADIQQANADQARLIRCYLRAVAQHSDSGLRAVVRSTDDDGPTGFSAADFAHTRDADRGTATALVTGDGVDSADATVTIRYADGARDQSEIHLADPASAHSWRFWNVGSYPTDPTAPSAAAWPSQ